MTATPAPALTAAELTRVQAFDAAPVLPESWEGSGEQSVDLTPGVVWSDAQLAVVRDLAARVHKAEAAVRRVEALHAPFGIYTDCDHEHTEDDLENGVAFEVMEVGSVCEDGLMYRVCESCCTGNGYQTEECATYHEHGKDEPICPTVAALATQAGDGAR